MVSGGERIPRSTPLNLNMIGRSEGRMDNNTVFIADEARLLKVKDVAKILNISKSLAYRLTQTGEIPVVKVNSAVRVRLTDLNEFIKTRIISIDKELEEKLVTK